MDAAAAPSGELIFDGQISGGLDRPVADVQVASRRLAWQDVVASDLSVTLHATADGVDLAAGRLAYARGAVTLGGHLAFDAGSPSRLAVSWRDVDVAASLVPLVASRAWLPAGTSAGELEAAGSIGDLSGATLDARILITGGANAPRRIAIPGESRLHVAGGQWTLAGTHAAAGAAPAAIALRGRLADEGVAQSSLEGTVTIARAGVPEAAEALRALDVVDLPSGLLDRGTLNVTATLSGRVASPSIVVDGRAEDVRIDGQPLETIRTNGRYNALDDAVVLEASIAPTALTPTGDRPLRGVVAGNLHARGTIDQLSGDAHASMIDGAWSEQPLGDIDIEAELQGRSVQITASAPRFAATGTVTLNTHAPYDVVTDVAATRLDIATVTAGQPSPTPLAGTASLVAHSRGTLQQWRQGSATLEVTDLDATAGSLPITLDGPAAFSIADQEFTVQRAAVYAGRARLTASGTLPVAASPAAAPGIAITADGDVGDVVTAIESTGLVDLPIVGGAGPLTFTGHIGGSLSAPTVTGDSDLGPATIAVENYPLVTNVRASARLRADAIDLRSASATYQGVEATANGSVPLAWLGVRAASATARPADATLSAGFRNVTPAILEPFLDSASIDELAGSLDLTLDLRSPTATIEGLQGELRIDRLDLRIADLPVTQRLPTRIVADGGFARIDAWDWTGQGATLAVRGQVRLADLQAGILADGALDLRMLTPFVRAAGVTTAGRLVPRLSITGPLTQPRIDGDIAIEAGELRLADPRIVVSNVSARALLSRTSAQLTALNGTINGGDLTVTGNAEYRPGSLASSLAATITGMAIEFPQGLRSEIDGDLTLAATRELGDVPRPASGTVGGTITVRRGAYREPLAVIGGLLTAARTRQVATAAASSPLLDALALDIRVVTDQDILVDNNTARLEAGGDLRLIGTAASPALSGRIDVREGGRIFLGRNTYEITSGRIDFVDPLTIAPELAVELTTRVGADEINVALSGPASNPSPTLSSPNPDLSQADLTALLVTGRTFDALGSADAALIGNTVLGNLSGDVLGFAGRAVGLDTLRLGGVDAETTRRDPTAVATETDPTSRLTFGRSFGRSLDVTLSQSLRDSGAQTWIVDYLPSRQLLLRLVSNDDDLRSYEFRHDLSIGGPPRIESAQASRRVAPRVVSVDITGTPGLDESRIREQLHLGPGDRFDFTDWQDDRDRLEELYRSEDRLAARISAERMDADGGVALTYRIDAGPATRIVVTGATLDNAAMGELRAAWIDAILDELFVAEARDIVNAALVADGYLQAQVMPRLMDQANSRTLTIDVVPGPRTTDVRLAIAEPNPDTERELNDWAGMAGFGSTAVRDPASVEAAVSEHLREQGFAAALVRVGAPRFEGSTAIVPVTVNAGASLSIDAVGFEGASLQVDMLRNAVDLTLPAPLDPVAVEAARNRLIAFYRREGFPDVQVAVRRSNPDGTTASVIVFAIAEGARQVVADIQISGNRRTDPDIIDKALQLSAGEPLRADDLLQARRRLFDTGLFRRVDITIGSAPAGPAGTAPMVVTVTLEEWPALRFRYGIEAAEERPDDDPTGRNLVPGLSADVTRRTLFGRAITTGASALYQRRERSGRLFLNAPTFLSLPIESSVSVGRSRRDVAADTLVSDVTSLSWEQRTHFGSVQLSYAYRFDRDHTFDTRPDATIPFDVTVNVARLTGSAAWDTRSDPADPARGSFVTGTLEWGPQSIGSEFRFVKETAQAYQFIPWRQLVFASAARVGVLTPLGGQEALTFERFFVGGSRSVRGVAEESLGEHDFLDLPVGGDAMLILNQEVRFPIFKWLRGVGFVDAGNVFDKPADLSLSRLATSVGAGLRLATPFAILRADYGRVVKTGEGRWTFGIGHAF
jgi:outer membrane protein assembly factor BamA/autotransporter translocation and assembly factor TamB